MKRTTTSSPRFLRAPPVAQAACTSLGLVWLLLNSLGVRADAPDYIYQFLTVPAYKATWGSAINNARESVFMAAAPIDIADVYQRTFLCDSSGLITEIRYPERRTTVALGINNLGTIVGDVSNPETSSYIGFIRAADGHFSNFIYPDAVGPLGGSQVNDVNDSGIIVGGYGIYRDGTNDGGAFIRLPDGEFESFRYLDDPTTIAFGINDLGQITGQSGSGSFLRDPDGTFLPIVFPGAEETQAFKINDLGQIVGVYYDGASHGFVRDPEGAYHTVDAPGATATSLWDINDFGELCGDANLGGRATAFVALVPEPSTLAMLGGVGFALVLILHRRTNTVNAKPILLIMLPVGALAADVSAASAQQASFFRIAGPVPVTITDITPNGTVTWTNTSQLYFDVSIIGQPKRLYHLVPVP